MPIVIGLIFFVFFGLMLLLFFLGLWGIWLLYSFLQKRKQKRAHRLAAYLSRLKPVVAELLHQANELDQASKYSGLDRDARWSKKYGDALNKLLEANAKLEETNLALVEQDLGTAQDCLLYVIRTIHVVTYRLKEMEPVEEIIELKVELQLEHERQLHATESSQNHSRDARAANASSGQTKTSSKDAQAFVNDQTKSASINQNAHEKPVLKVNDKEKEILRDDSGKI